MSLEFPHKALFLPYFQTLSLLDHAPTALEKVLRIIFLTSSQVMLMVLILGPHSEESPEKCLMTQSLK